MLKKSFFSISVIVLIAILSLHFLSCDSQNISRENSSEADYSFVYEQNKKLGRWGDIGCFSFEEKKCMTTGDGGMICSDDKELIEPLKAYRWVGIDKDTWRRAKNYTNKRQLDAMHWYYEIAVLGYKYNMNDLAAAIGLAQLKKLDWMNRQRGRCIKRYLNGIRNLKYIKPIMPFEPDKYVYWIFGVRCERRDDLIIYLKSKGIATGVHYMPLSLHPLFKRYKNRCPIADKAWKEFVSLPTSLCSIMLFLFLCTYSIGSSIVII